MSTQCPCCGEYGDTRGTKGIRVSTSLGVKTMWVCGGCRDHVRVFPCMKETNNVSGTNNNVKQVAE